MSESALKLFVWESVMHDYSAGIAFALAHDSEEARKLIEKKMGYLHGDLANSPRIVETSEGFGICGGG